MRVRDVSRVLVASPDYLRERGTPASVAQLHAHALLAFDGFAPNGEWRFAGPGRPSVRLEPRLLTNDMDSAIDAAVDGLGIARCFCYQVQARLATGDLVRVLDEAALPPVPVSLVFQAQRQRSAAVRAFLDLARTALRSA